jgi:hypothetical protein
MPVSAHAQWKNVRISANLFASEREFHDYIGFWGRWVQLSHLERHRKWNYDSFCACAVKNVRISANPFATDREFHDYIGFEGRWVLWSYLERDRKWNYGSFCACAVKNVRISANPFATEREFHDCNRFWGSLSIQIKQSGNSMAMYR